MVEITALALGVLLAQATPGPNMAAVAASALSGGRRAGVLTAAGVAAGVLVWAALFAAGVGAVLNARPELMIAMKLVGGAYLTYLGGAALCSLIRRQRPQNAARAAHTVRRPFATGLLVVLTNPKAAAMWVAIALFAAGAGWRDQVFFAIGPAAALSAFAIYGSYAILFSTDAAHRMFTRFEVAIKSGFGLVFGALGARLLLEGVAELRR